MVSIAHIAIPCPLRQTFDYLCEDESCGPGMRVRVPFGHRSVTGIVIAVSKLTSQYDSKKLKTITEILEDPALIPQDIMQLISWVSQYYHHPVGECFQVALPKKIRQGEPAEISTESHWFWLKDTDKTLGKNQQQIMQLLKQSTGGVSQKQLITSLKVNSSTLLSLEKKGLIKKEISIKKPPITENSEPFKKLNAQQQAAVDTVIDKADRFIPYLLQGITGSGKTEVYIHLSAMLLRQGKQVLILIPEIGLTEQFVRRFTQQLATSIVVINSSMTDIERQQAWLLAKEGVAGIVIGTRSAVFTPLKHPGLIIIDEEHDSSYKQQETLRYHARSVALVRAKQAGIPVMLGSATPSLESLYQLEKKNYILLTLNERATGAKLPGVEMVDLNGPKASNSLSSTLYREIQHQLDNNNQVLLFLNRRGFAPVLMCHQCDWQALCPDCDAKMIVHRNRYQLRCHHCGFVQTLPQQCPDCQADDLNTYGVGTEQIEQSLQQLYPETEIIRIDRDSTQHVGAFSSIVKKVNEGGAKILVGTQMLAKGHDFHDITLVGVLDADQGLFSADYRAMESLAQLIVQVTGRAGRGKKAGKVLIQTSQVDHPFWRNLVQYGYQKTVKEILQQRIETNMPPAGHLSLIRARSKQSDTAMNFLTELANVLRKKQSENVLILGPVPSVMEKKAGYYRAQLLLNTSQRAALHRLLDDSIDEIQRLKLSKKVHWSIDIDPLELF